MNEFGAIREIVLRRQPDLVGVVDRVDDGPIDDDEVDRIQFTLADELLEFGIEGVSGERYNDYGHRLEALIDFANQCRPEFRRE